MSDVVLTLDRERPLDPPDVFMRLQERATMHRMRYADGHVGWLVTGHAAARAVLADSRFSNRLELGHSPIPPWLELFKRAREQRSPTLPGNFLRMDASEHARYRRLLAGHFTVRRMIRLEPRIEEITEACLDDMEAQGAPADVVRTFALPIPSLVICELLGVPHEERGQLQEDSTVLFSLAPTMEDRARAEQRLTGYLRGLVHSKRAEPADDLLSILAASGELTDEELTGVAFLLLVAGHETTANMLALGTYALLTHPGQLKALRADASLMTNAVEELMRYLTVFQIGPTRAALEDVEVDGNVIRKGESVTIHLAVANRDPARFPVRGERLDITEPASGHLAFGHGIHQCLGQQLARIEMRVGYTALLRRFPHLSLAASPTDASMRADSMIYGMHRLLVTW
ncbi:cytochrome P450 [[Actinomadura] parvosata]|uniref:cytochrome P450 n=1 Tax=[Actinomadura] parvosata TaxID=1955412 RepID=UPI001645C85B